MAQTATDFRICVSWWKCRIQRANVALLPFLTGNSGVKDRHRTP